MKRVDLNVSFTSYVLSSMYHELKKKFFTREFERTCGEYGSESIFQDYHNVTKASRRSPLHIRREQLASFKEFHSKLSHALFRALTMLEQ